jgi:hypothetical protein
MVIRKAHRFHFRTVASIPPSASPYEVMTSGKRTPKTKTELREMLAEAVRNTQPQPEPKIKPIPKAKKGRR